MRNSRKDEVFDGIFGARYGVIDVPSWRRPRMCEAALLEVLKRNHGLSELPEPFEAIVTSKPMQDLALAALAPGSEKVAVWTALSRQYDERVRKRLSEHPGQASELLQPDGIVDSHLVDHVFVEHWMKDPQFHIG